MGKVTLDMEPCAGRGFLRFNNYCDKGKAETDNGTVDATENIESMVHLTIKKSLARQAQLPENFRIIIEWD